MKKAAKAIAPEFPQHIARLKRLGSFALHAQKRFTAREHYSGMGVLGARVTIVWNGFIEAFFTKKEAEEGKTDISYHELMTGLTHSQVLEELGGEEGRELSLSQFHCLLTKQGQGEEGVLLTNGSDNWFYIRDIGGTLCSVRLFYSKDNRGWNISNWPIRGKGLNLVGSRMFTRS